MKKHPFFFTFLFLITLSSAFADITINTEVYKFTSKSGTPVFSDTVPPKRKFKKKTIMINQPETADEDHEDSRDYKNSRDSRDNRKLIEQNMQRMLDKSFQNYTPQEATEKKPKKTSVKICKKYKKRFDKVSDKMRIGYSANEYRGLEAKRVKYRDLLFNKCNSFDLI